MSYAVIFRMGGTENYRWQATIGYPTIMEADAAQAEITRGGRAAMTVHSSFATEEILASLTYEGRRPGFRA